MGKWVMFFKAENYRHPAFMEGVRDLAPQVPGVAAWGLMTGVAMVNSGLSVFEALAMTLLVYAGSSQLAVLPLIVAGAPVWVILATGFCVNLRFMVFSLHLRKYLMHLPRLERMLHGYLTTDISYVLFIRRFANPSNAATDQLKQAASLAGNTGIVWVSWMVASFFGIFLANIIPTSWGLGFAGTLCLVGILCSLASTRMRIFAAVVAAGTAIAAYHLPLKLNIVIAIGVAVVLSMSLERFQKTREGQVA
jgi:predicted branched-subunit amino acid permease